MSAAYSMIRAGFFLAALGSAQLFVATPASAAESLKRVGIQAGFAGMAAEGSFAGFGGALSAGYGVTDALTLTAWASGSSNQVSQDSGRALVLSQALGLNYALDIVQVVPYFGAALAAYEFVDYRGAQAKLGAQLVLGADYMLTRTWAVGLELRGHTLPIDLVESPDNPAIFYATSFLKCEYVWGWF